MNFLSILNKADLSLTCCCCCWVAAQQATFPLPVISDLRKRRGKKKGRLWPASLRTHPNIHTKGGAGATSNPREQHLFVAAFPLLFFFIIWSSCHGKGFVSNERALVICTVLCCSCVSERAPVTLLLFYLLSCMCGDMRSAHTREGVCVCVCGGAYCKIMNTLKLWPYDDARAGAVCIRLIPFPYPGTG